MIKRFLLLRVLEIYYVTFWRTDDRRDTICYWIRIHFDGWLDAHQVRDERAVLVYLNSRFAGNLKTKPGVANWKPRVCLTRDAIELSMALVINVVGTHYLTTKKKEKSVCRLSNIDFSLAYLSRMHLQVLDVLRRLGP